MDVGRTSPTARALLALELIQGSPGITADRLADKLGVSERAARRYVAILREAGIPIESVRGPYGGYRVGRGLRLPPLVFTATEALGLVMAVLDGHHDAGDPTDPVGSALGKIVRALPGAGGRPGRGGPPDAPRPRPTAPPPGPTRGPRPPSCRPAPTTAGCGSATAPRRGRSGTPRSTRGRSSSATAGGTCSATSHAADALRAYRIDRVRGVEVLDDDLHRRRADLDPVGLLEEHLAVGWEYDVEVVIDAPLGRRRALPPAGPRPPRAGRRRHDPAGRQHEQPVVVRRAAGRRSRRRTGSWAARSCGDAASAIGRRLLASAGEQG